jgi:hypothetical protein
MQKNIEELNHQINNHKNYDKDNHSKMQKYEL